MKCNIGRKDRLFRLGLGFFFIILALAIGLGDIAAKVLFATGLVSMFSGALGYCFAHGLCERACAARKESTADKDQPS